MTEISRFDGIDPHDRGDEANDSSAAAFTESDADAFANMLANDPAPEIDLSGIEGDNAIQKHLLGEKALESSKAMSLDDLLEDIQTKGE